MIQLWSLDCWHFLGLVSKICVEESASTAPSAGHTRIYTNPGQRLLSALNLCVSGSDDINTLDEKDVWCHHLLFLRAARCLMASHPFKGDKKWRLYFFLTAARSRCSSENFGRSSGLYCQQRCITLYTSSGQRWGQAILYPSNKRRKWITGISFEVRKWTVKPS